MHSSNGAKFLRLSDVLKKSYKYDLDFDFAKHNLNVLMEIKRIQLRHGSMQSFIENLNNKENSLLHRTVKGIEEGKVDIDFGEKAG